MTFDLLFQLLGLALFASLFLFPYLRAERRSWPVTILVAFVLSAAGLAGVTLISKTWSDSCGTIQARYDAAVTAFLREGRLSEVERRQLARADDPYEAFITLAEEHAPAKLAEVRLIGDELRACQG